KTIDISVTSVLQTTAGKMIFGKWDERGTGHRDSKSPPPVSAPAVTAPTAVPSDPTRKTTSAVADRPVD
ncbi:MAG: hypothetical protein ABR908_14670, partial [Terriglobales bacterium]